MSSFGKMFRTIFLGFVCFFAVFFGHWEEAVPWRCLCQGTGLFSAPLSTLRKKKQDLITLARKGKEGHSKAMNISAAGAKSAMTLIRTPVCDVGPNRAWEDPKRWPLSLCAEWRAMQKCQVPPVRTSFVLTSARRDSLWALQITSWNHPCLNLGHIASLFCPRCQPEGFFSLQIRAEVKTENLRFLIQGVLHKKYYLTNNSYKSCEIIGWVSL